MQTVTLYEEEKTLSIKKKTSGLSRIMNDEFLQDIKGYGQKVRPKLSTFAIEDMVHP